MLIHKSRIRLLPKSRELDSTLSDCSKAVAEYDSTSNVVQSEESVKQLCNDEHPTAVEVAPDCSDKHNIPAKSKMKKQPTKKVCKNNHPMKLRPR